MGNVKVGPFDTLTRADRRGAKALAAPTSWIVKRPFASPSRGAVARSVPDYARRLMRD